MSEYVWLTDMSRQFLENDYLVHGESVESRIDVICQNAERILALPGFADKFKNNIKRGWYSLSSPIWANFGLDRGLPISCYGSYISDDMESILSTQAEIGMMTKFGGGTSAYFGNLRSRGSKISTNGESSGSVHFMKLFDNIINIISQGQVRRGSFAAYLPIEHQDIEEFLHIKSDGNPIQNISFGVCVSDNFMEEMIAGNVDKRRIWAKVLESRINTGYPYIVFIDNVNKFTCDVYKDKKLKITHSNLCSEILLPDSEDESFVCDLSSMNIYYYDNWKNTDAVELLTYFLDAVMTEFIDKGNKIKFMERPVKFARRHRALGIGWLGWHSYLQSKMIPFESIKAKALNIQVAKNIYENSRKASNYLSYGYGEPELLKGYGRRNTTTCAIAPTKSSSFIIGQMSEGVEPHRSNYYIKDLEKGKFSIKNPHLQKLLQEKDTNKEAIWKSILDHSGSVQHLDFLSIEEKDVFKTFAEISPLEVIIQAAQRQPYIDQGQSINLMIHPTTPVKDINQLMIEAWKMGVKTLYYQISVSASQEFSRNILSCKNCES